jgi:hypothetical protein
MTIVSRIAVAIAVAAAAVSSAAFAQSSNQNLGMGTHQARHHKMSPVQAGSRAFAMVPSFQGGGRFDPALSGGGSAGYNENLHKDQW